MRSLFGRQVTPDGLAGAQRLRDHCGHFDRRSRMLGRRLFPDPSSLGLMPVPLLQ